MIDTEDLMEGALLADGFEEALIGTVRQFNRGPIALYDYNKCVQILMDRDGMPEEDAHEHMEFNVLGAWMGEGTPAFAFLDLEIRDSMLGLRHGDDS
jgi:hypothetical protein